MKSFSEDELIRLKNQERDAMREQCAEFLASFAVDYVNKWAKTTGDSAKAEGWAILQAAGALRAARF